MIRSAVLEYVFGDLLPRYFRKSLALVQGSRTVVETVQLGGDDFLQQSELQHESAREQAIGHISTTYILLLPHRLANAVLPRFDQRPIAAPQGRFGHRGLQPLPDLLVREALRFALHQQTILLLALSLGFRRSASLISILPRPTTMRLASLGEIRYVGGRVCRVRSRTIVRALVERPCGYQAAMVVWRTSLGGQFRRPRNRRWALPH